MAMGISMATRKELTQKLAARYEAATRSEKTRILDEFVAVTGYHRKHAIRLLTRRPRPSRGNLRVGRKVYDEAVKAAAILVWEAADRICGKRLRAILPQIVSALEEHGRCTFDPEVRKKLLAASAATLDRLLLPARSTARHRKRRHPAPTAIKRQVRVRTFADWGEVEPGFFEVDFVAHNGGRCAGSFVHTLVLTDICSTWTECIPLVVRNQALVVEALQVLEPRLPIAILGIDTDNDSAFLNEMLVDYCAARAIDFTRSRAYRKNDQAWVEQKNRAVVRRMVGYGRLTGPVATQTLAQLYQAARLYVNFFQPSFKLRSKQRNGSRVTKTYHQPTTPCDRLLAHPGVSDSTKRALEALRAKLDPIVLLHAIRRAQEALAKLVTHEPPDTQAADDLATFLEKLPSLWRQGDPRPTHRQELPTPRWWRTRADPFEGVWPRILEWLNEQPDATAASLFERLRREYPGEFEAGQLRTLQRRVKDWRRLLASQLIHGAAEPMAVVSISTEKVQGR